MTRSPAGARGGPHQLRFMPRASIRAWSELVGEAWCSEAKVVVHSANTLEPG